MTAIALDESSTSTKPAWRWIALLLLLLAASLIALTVYGVVYERKTKMLVSEARVEAQLGETIGQSTAGHFSPLADSSKGSFRSV